jgi:malate synthase
MKIETVVAIQILTAVLWTLVGHGIGYQKGIARGFMRARAIYKRQNGDLTNAR